MASKIRKMSATPMPMPALAPMLRPLVDGVVVKEVLGWSGMTEIVAVWVTRAGGEVEEGGVGDEDMGEEIEEVGEDEVGVGVAVDVEERDVDNGCAGVDEVVMVWTPGHCDVQSVVPAHSSNDADAQQPPSKDPKPAAQPVMTGAEAVVVPTEVGSGGGASVAPS